ncbi:unnamed protein product, partial [Rotaria magnacalcarata]
KRERESKDVESMFKLGAAQAEAATATTTTAATTVASNAKTKKNEPETALHKNNPQQIAKKGHVDNTAKMSSDNQSPAPYNSSSSKANTDFLDRQLFEKADLDYIPGLDYDLGPVFIPTSLEQLPGLDQSAAAAKARAEEEARKKREAAAAEADAKRKEQTTRVVKPILPYSSMFIFSSTN